MVWGFAILVSGLSVIGNERNPITYNILVIAVCFFLPLLVILVAQGTIFVKIHQTRRAGEQRSINNIKREIRAAKTISIMIFLFVVGWMPFFIISLIKYAKKIEYSAHVIFAVKFLQYSNSLFNPILYAQKFPDFRRAYVAMLCACFKSNKEQYKHAFNPSFTYRSGTYRSVLVQSPQVKHRFTKVEVDGSVSMVSSPSPSKTRKKTEECMELQAKYTVDEPSAEHVALNLHDESSSDDATNDEQAH
jgi:dolichyl-phosphate-mannose--protein O-mannosyl transferase